MTISHIFRVIFASDIILYAWIASWWLTLADRHWFCAYLKRTHSADLRFIIFFILKTLLCLTLKSKCEKNNKTLFTILWKLWLDLFFFRLLLSTSRTWVCPKDVNRVKSDMPCNYQFAKQYLTLIKRLDNNRLRYSVSHTFHIIFSQLISFDVFTEIFDNKYWSDYQFMIPFLYLSIVLFIWSEFVQSILWTIRWSTSFVIKQTKNCKFYNRFIFFFDSTNLATKNVTSRFDLVIWLWLISCKNLCEFWSNLARRWHPPNFLLKTFDFMFLNDEF